MFKLGLFFRMFLKIVGCLGFILVALMMLFPVQLQSVKVLLLLSIIFLSFFLPIKLKGKDCKTVLLWGYLYALMGLFSICYGFILNNPSPQKYVTIYLIWPLLFTYLSIFISKTYFYRLMCCARYCLLANLLLGIIACLYFNINFVQEGFFLGYEPTIRPGFSIIAIAGGAVTSVMFWYFFFFTLIILQQKTGILDYVILLLGVVFIFMTSRRVLFLNFALVPLFIFCLLFFIKHRSKKELMFRVYRNRMFLLLICLFFMVLLVGNLGLFDFTELSDFFYQISEASDEPRRLQAQSLLEGWMENPIFGHGAGVNASVVRSNIPGTYELSYLAMLFERGIIGVTLFIVQYIILMYWSIKALNKGRIHSNYVLSLIVAVNLFLIANATNPYLGAFDYMWFLFLLLAVVRISNEERHEEYLCTNKGL